MTDIEKEEIIQKTIERLLVILPEVVGNLMTANAMNAKLIDDFYTANPEFKNYKDISQNIIFKIEKDNPKLSYEDILSKATPLIKQAITTAKDLNFQVPSKDSCNGVI